MIILVQLLGVIMIGLSIVVLIKPILLRQFISFMSKGKRYYATGIIKLMYGTLFLMVAPQAKFIWLIALLGLEGLVKGAYVLVGNPEKIKSVYNLWFDKSEVAYRIFTMFLIVLWLLVLATL